MDARRALAGGGDKRDDSRGFTRGDRMSNDLTNSQTALLSDIGEYDISKTTAEQNRDLEHLISEGYVEPTKWQVASGFKPTRKGIEFLGEHGAGVNET